MKTPAARFRDSRRTYHYHLCARRHDLREQASQEDRAKRQGLANPAL